ncbi:MAG: hypothetical protein IPK80_00225 [Nannocystis sp.]|nr:hypothetical protein [Nannocystis sp.]
MLLALLIPLAVAFAWCSNRRARFGSAAATRRFGGHAALTADPAFVALSGALRGRGAVKSPARPAGW